jgi:hypothetical protein
MADDDILNDDVDETDDGYDWSSESVPRTRARMLESRRRIEDLKELRRMRELLDDDEFVLDF